MVIQKDFNIIDLFSIFDINERGHLIPSEFEAGLHHLKIFASKEEVYLMTRRYDKLGNGKLRYNDFEAIFMPLEKHYRNILAKRCPLSEQKKIVDVKEVTI